MAVKRLMLELQPWQLYVMLSGTLLLLIMQLVLAHVTHALTLLVDAYHMLCNLISLAGCVVTIKHERVEREDEDGGSCCGETPGAPAHAIVESSEQEEQRRHKAQARRRRVLKNTFGWARVDVLVTLVVCVLLASFCFSLLVEALQTLVHIGHQDEIHHALLVLIMGAAGLLLNGLCYLLIGGYTFHQASFLHVTASGDVVLDNVGQAHSWPIRQGPREMARDTLGSILVIICAVTVCFTDAYVAKFVDPVLSIISAISLLVLSYPYMKESGLILLQTIPDTINIESFRVELIKEFPDIINVHDLHVWRLTPNKVYCTVHIIFLNPKDYTRKSQKILDFFLEQGITQVTVQPEFFKMDYSNTNGIASLPSVEDKHCLVQCRELGCVDRHCCQQSSPTSITVVNQQAENICSRSSISADKLQETCVNHSSTTESFINSFDKQRKNERKQSSGSIAVSSKPEVNSGESAQCCEVTGDKTVEGSTELYEVNGEDNVRTHDVTREKSTGVCEVTGVDSADSCEATGDIETYNTTSKVIVQDNEGMLELHSKEEGLICERL